MDLDDASALESTKKETREIHGKLLVKDLIATQMVSTRPVIRAIHSGPTRTRLERELLPLLQTRDLLTTTLLNLTTQLSHLQHAYTAASTTLTKRTNTNIELAERVKQLSIANKVAEGIPSSERVAAKKAEMIKERRRCETLKGVVQAIIVGSGINWAEDEGLRRLVLECGDD